MAKNELPDHILQTVLLIVAVIRRIQEKRLDNAEDTRFNDSKPEKNAESGKNESKNRYPANG